MHLNRRIFQIAVAGMAAALVFALAGCNFMGLTPKDRAQAFIDAMNTTSRANVRDTHIHPDAANYAQIGDDGAEYWDVYFPESEAGSFELKDTDMTATAVEGTLYSETTYSDGTAVIFNMNPDGLDSKIEFLQVGLSTVVKR